MRGLIGRKVGMTQLFDEESGRVTSVTVIEAGPCPVVAVRSPDIDGYEAVQLAYEQVADRKISRAERGHLSKNGVDRAHGRQEGDSERADASFRRRRAQPAAREGRRAGSEERRRRDQRGRALMAAPKAPVLGGTKKEVSLEESVFGADVKPHLVHEA